MERAKEIAEELLKPDGKELRNPEVCWETFCAKKPQTEAGWRKWVLDERQIVDRPVRLHRSLDAELDSEPAGVPCPPEVSAMFDELLKAKSVQAPKTLEEMTPAERRERVDEERAKMRRTEAEWDLQERRRAAGGTR